jgi:GH15 family glucan-1,4-alpha-glucosidase
MASRIEHYGFLSNCSGSALVSSYGAIDWLCLPRFDSDASMAGLLGRNEQGRWSIDPQLVPEGFVLRYRTDQAQDGLPGSEGAFLACSFWLVDAYAVAGRRKDAETLFERLLTLRNDLGLLAEEYDPMTGRLIGNFPQAFSHLALVHSANLLGVLGTKKHAQAA